jgi:predicted O-methyltransferase YrrM
VIAPLARKMIPERFRPIGYLNHLARKQTGCRVLQGPFAGMRYIEKSIGSAYIPKLVGIYERELAHCVEAICSSRPSMIVDLGAAEGYYAIGLARRNPQARIVAFEMEPDGQSALAEMAALNGVSGRLEIRGKCELLDLALTLGNEPRPFVVCDVEGYEERLLAPEAVPALNHAAVLVELHDFLVPGITETLKQRFNQTHHIQHIWQEARTRSDFPWRTLGTMLLPHSYLDWAVSEWRPVRMAWLWMKPRE